ncbi:MAG: methyltransferase domain-containing protein [Leifsonia sp.]
MRIDERGLSILRHEIEGAATIDVTFDGQRVWSTRVESDSDSESTDADDPEIFLAWPAALMPYLNGRTAVEIRDSANGRPLAAGEARLGSATSRIAVVDAQGRHLAMNKWDRLGVVFEGNDSGVKQRLLASAAAAVDVLERAGYPVYIVGGTLLGYMRNGGLLPHDDDIDLAYLCEESDPADISLTSYRMERTLKAAGFVVVRHSLAHLELDFFDEAGHVDYYIDIFTGYFRDGEYCQPFALRGDQVTPADLVPVKRIEVDGVVLPAPARPEAWLEYAYGPGWRVPDPTFQFVTPRSTRDRFETWFGVYNRARVFWDKRYAKQDGLQSQSTDDQWVDEFLDRLPAGANVLDLGCGDGAVTERIARAGHRVVGVDYSNEALNLARSSSKTATDYRFVNLNDRHALFTLGFDLIETREPWWVFGHQLLQGMTKTNRRNVFFFLNLVLRGDAEAYVTMDTELPDSYRREDPTTWHLPVEWLHDEIVGYGLRYETRSAGISNRYGIERRTVAATIRRLDELAASSQGVEHS